MVIIFNEIIKKNSINPIVLETLSHFAVFHSAAIQSEKTGGYSGQNGNAITCTIVEILFSKLQYIYF